VDWWLFAGVAVASYLAGTPAADRFGRDVGTAIAGLTLARARRRERARLVANYLRAREGRGVTVLDDNMIVR